MRTFTPALSSLIDTKVHSLCTCWKITRTDGVIFRFTDHNAPIVIPEGTYVAAGGFSSSARQRQEGLQTRNFECIGIINSDAITQADLRAGRYREAKIEESVVNWKFPFAGPLFGATYWIEEVTFDGSRWNARVSDVSRWLRVAIGDVYGRNCRYDLGDAECTVNKAAFNQTVTVTSVPSVRRIFRATGLTGADGLFQYGEVLFNTGLNTGLRGEVKLYTSATDQVELQLAMPFDIAVGNSVTLSVGCGKTVEYCKGTSGTAGAPWSTNLVNFGGFPTIPGTDAILETPNTK